MKKHLIVIGTAVLLLAVGLCGCVEQEVGKEKEQDQQEQDQQEQEIEYDDTAFIVWVAEDSQSTSYYDYEILDMLAEDLVDVDFTLLLTYVDARMKLIEQSEEEIKSFYLSSECEKIRECWDNVLLNRWYADYYTLYRLKIFSEDPFDEELFVYYSDLVVDYTKTASQYVTETWRLMEIAVEHIG